MNKPLKNRLKVPMHLTGKKDVGSATSNCNDAASINNVVNEETQDEQSLPPQSEVNRY